MLGCASVFDAQVLAGLRIVKLEELGVMRQLVDFLRFELEVVTHFVQAVVHLLGQLDVASAVHLGEDESFSGGGGSF